MIVEINEMIDFIDDFFSSDRHETVVGGIAGTQIEKFVIEGATKNTDFGKVLFVQGCQDYMFLMKKPIPNMVYWGDLFIDMMVDPLIPRNPWIPEIYNPKPEYIKSVIVEKIAAYDVIVVLNATLIDRRYIKSISEKFAGKIIYIIDPAETGTYDNSMCHMCNMATIPVVVDTLEKVSPMIALARSVLGFESRAIDKSVPGTLNEINKINRRSIGKIDDKQYITADWALYDEIIKKQHDSPFRKNQKVLVDENIIHTQNSSNPFKTSLTHNSMLVIQNPTSTPLMKCRLYNSNVEYNVDVDYNFGVLKRRGVLTVKPANIIMMHDVGYHRYNHSVVLLTNDIDLRKKEKYSVLKNSNNVTIVNNVK